MSPVVRLMAWYNGKACTPRVNLLAHVVAHKRRRGQDVGDRVKEESSPFDVRRPRPEELHNALLAVSPGELDLASADAVLEENRVSHVCKPGRHVVAKVRDAHPRRPGQFTGRCARRAAHTVLTARDVANSGSGTKGSEVSRGSQLAKPTGDACAKMAADSAVPCHDVGTLPGDPPPD